MKNIGIEQSVSNNALYEHKFLQKINKLYKHAGKCDNQQQLKDILEAAIVSTTEVLTDNNPRSPMGSTPVNKPIAGKSLCLFTKISDVKNKTATRRVGDSKSESKANKFGTTPWVFKLK